MSSKDADRLVELAQLLNCPLAAFDDEEFVPQHLKDTAAMVQLWFALGPSEERDQLLMMARHLIGTQAERHNRRFD